MEGGHGVNKQLSKDKHQKQLRCVSANSNITSTTGVLMVISWKEGDGDRVKCSINQAIAIHHVVDTDWLLVLNYDVNLRTANRGLVIGEYRGVGKKNYVNQNVTGHM